MFCKNCGQELSPNAKFCPGCGATFEEEKTEIPSRASEKDEERQSPVEYVENQPSNENIDDTNKSEDITTNTNSLNEDTPSSPEETPNIEEVTNPAENKGIIYNYKNFKSLSTKKKVLYVAIPIIILFVLINSFGGISDKKYISAAQQVVTDPTSGNYLESNLYFTGGKVVDKDKYGRALVLLKYNSIITDKSEVILVIYDLDNSNNTFRYYKYRNVALFGRSITQDQLNSMKYDVDWGTPID